MGQDNAERRSHASHDGNKGISELICFSFFICELTQMDLIFSFSLSGRGYASSACGKNQVHRGMLSIIFIPISLDN
jgi:hypothetical protein